MSGEQPLDEDEMQRVVRETKGHQKHYQGEAGLLPAVGSSIKQVIGYRIKQHDQHTANQAHPTGHAILLQGGEDEAGGKQELDDFHAPGVGERFQLQAGERALKEGDRLGQDGKVWGNTGGDGTAHKPGFAGGQLNGYTPEREEQQAGADEERPDGMIVDRSTGGLAAAASPAAPGWDGGGRTTHRFCPASRSPRPLTRGRTGARSHAGAVADVLVRSAPARHHATGGYTA